MTPKRKQRLDQYLLERGIVQDLRQAQALIMAGQVLVSEQRADKPGLLVASGSDVRVKDHSRFVSRGGDKLWGAIEDLALTQYFARAVVLDCGASTGGFTDCALQLGATKVYALDIGFNQLAWKLRTDPRVQVMEQTDIRDIDQVLDNELRIVLADISFNSLDRILPALGRVVPKAEVNFVLLVKPQFELDVADVPQGGVVTEDQLRIKALEKAKLAIERQGFEFIRSVDSRVAGREGNLEIFVHAIRRASF